MTSSPLNGVKAFAFDAYGTLFDVHSAVARHRERMGGNADCISGLWRQKQLEYTWLRSLMGRHVDFWQVTGDALDFAFASVSTDDDNLKNDLMQAYLALDAYPEVPATLEALSSRGHKLAILSNGSPAMLSSAVGHAGLDGLFDHVLSVEACGIYKPDNAVYRLANEAFDLASEDICFLSSNAWDAAGAADFGFRVVWINRFSQPRECLPGDPVAEITTLDQLISLLDRP